MYKNHIIIENKKLGDITIINLLHHKINIVTQWDTIIGIPGARIPARLLDIKCGKNGISSRISFILNNDLGDEINICKIKSVHVQGLPNYDEETTRNCMYIVPREVAMAFPERKDLYFPIKLYNDGITGKKNICKVLGKFW